MKMLTDLYGALDPELSWLEDQPVQNEWAIDESDAPATRRFDSEQLVAVLPTGVIAPPALLALAARPDLQRRIRSVTGCYLDLGDFAIRTSMEGGYLVHLLSDQQWCLHWLVCVDANGSESVVTTAEPLGFKLGSDDWEKPIPPVVPLDGSYDLQVCADSVNEFLYRFWIENELFYAGGKASREPLLAYASAFRAQGPSGQPGASLE
jgi:hypothetical protein